MRKWAKHGSSPFDPMILRGHRLRICRDSPKGVMSDTRWRFTQRTCPVCCSSSCHIVMLIGWQRGHRRVNHDYEVGGVAGGGQLALPLGSLVKRTPIQTRRRCLCWFLSWFNFGTQSLTSSLAIDRLSSQNWSTLHIILMRLLRLNTFTSQFVGSSVHFRYLPPTVDLWAQLVLKFAHFVQLNILRVQWGDIRGDLRLFESSRTLRPLLSRFKPNYWHFGVELFGDWLAEALVFVVPPATLKVQATDQSPICRFVNLEAILFSFASYENIALIISRVLLICVGELKTERINFNLMLSGIVLQKCCQKRMSEEEAWKPEDFGWFLIVDPLVQSAYSEV